MQSVTRNENSPVAQRLRPVVYLYAAINIAVAALLLSTVSPTVPLASAQAVASLR